MTWASPLAVLERAYADNRRRTEQVQLARDHAMDVLAESGIDAIPMKGAHWLLAGWLPDPVARTTVDVDLLIAPRVAPRGQQLLQAAGFTPVASAPDEWADHQLPSLVAPNGAVAVELHLAPLISVHGAVISTEEIVAGARRLPDDPDGPRLPDVTDALTLLVAHAQLQDFNHRYRRLPLRALVDLVSLRNSGVLDDVDWMLVQQRFDRAGEQAALAGFAVAAQEAFGLTVPVNDKGGEQWFRSAWRSMGSPRRARWIQRRVALQIALGPDRMDRLYGTHDAWGRSRARIRHVVRGGARRSVGRPAADPSPSPGHH